MLEGGKKRTASEAQVWGGRGGGVVLMTFSGISSCGGRSSSTGYVLKKKWGHKSLYSGGG